MSEGELQSLARDGKYFQLSQKVLEELRSPETTHEKADSLFHGIVMPNSYNLHPWSFAEISSIISDTLPTEEGIELLEGSIKRLMEQSVDVDAGEDTSGTIEERALRFLKVKQSSGILRLLLDIAYKATLLDSEEALVRAKNIIYECKALPLERSEILARLYLGMGILHFRSMNYSSSFNSLVEYFEMSQDRSLKLLAHCAVAGILSGDIFSFNRLTVIWGNQQTGDAQDLQRQNLLLLLSMIDTGDTASVSHAISNESLLNSCGIPSLTDVDLLKQGILRKATVNRMLTHFFHNQERVASVSALAEEMNLPTLQVEALILDMVGSGLVKGTIDGVSGLFFYSWIKHRVLSIPEVSSIKSLISALNQRVHQTLKEFPAGA